MGDAVRRVGVLRARQSAAGFTSRQQVIVSVLLFDPHCVIFPLLVLVNHNYRNLGYSSKMLFIYILRGGGLDDLM